MSAQARQFFDRYVVQYLNDPQLGSLSLQSHVFTLLSQARSARIPPTEITDEVGPLLAAFSAAMSKDRH